MKAFSGAKEEWTPHTVLTSHPCSWDFWWWFCGHFTMTENGIHCFSSILYQCWIPCNLLKMSWSRKIKHLSNTQQALDFQAGRLLIYCLPPWVDSWVSAKWRCPSRSSFASLAMRVAFVCWTSKWRLCSSLPSSYLVKHTLNMFPKCLQSLPRGSSQAFKKT